MHSDAGHHIPNRLSAVTFRAKATLLQSRRAFVNAFTGIHRLRRIESCDFQTPIASCSTALWTDPSPAEQWYQRGKVQNLRLAAARLNGVFIPSGAIFSFWAQLGRASHFKGYVRGRMLQEGCLIPAIGGGLCQLSNALYQAALDAGCEIVERHPHSRVVPGSATASGRDATVAWNYIDLRFRPKQPIQLRVYLTASDLHVALYEVEAATPANSAVARPLNASHPKLQPGALPIFNDHACESCGQIAFFRADNDATHLKVEHGKAFLLDTAWPEFADYVKSHHSSSDKLAIPLDGVRWDRKQYAWPTEGFADVSTAQLTTILRSLRSRHLATQGAARQAALLESARELAGALARSLDQHTDEVCISQNLLPFLWSTGVLGGRRVTVLCTQLPLANLQAQLDRAYQLHPESPTLRDFRAKTWIVEAEAEALQCAERIVTPHLQVAALFAEKTHLLEWKMPAVSPQFSVSGEPASRTILFPCSTLGRKGIYELREALRDAEIHLKLGGAVLEHADFWRGFNVERVNLDQPHGFAVAVQPSIVESQPRALLKALASGIPAIATDSCGLTAMQGLTIVPTADATALRKGILTLLQ